MHTVVEVAHAFDFVAGLLYLPNCFEGTMRRGHFVGSLLNCLLSCCFLAIKSYYLYCSHSLVDSVIVECSALDCFFTEQLLVDPHFFAVEVLSLWKDSVPVLACSISLKNY